MGIVSCAGEAGARGCETSVTVVGWPFLDMVAARCAQSFQCSFAGGVCQPPPAK